MPLVLRRLFCLAATFGLCALQQACTPTDDWREMRPDGAQLVAQFPCRPAKQARAVRVGDQSAVMTLHACSTADATYAVGWLDVADPASMEPALESLKAAALANTSARDKQAIELPLQVPGATAQRRAGRWQWQGKLPDDRSIIEQFAAFTRGTRVVQALVLFKATTLTALQQQRADTFFAGLAWRE